MGNIDRIFQDPIDTLSVETIMDTARAYWYPGRKAPGQIIGSARREQIHDMIRDYQQNCVINYWFPVAGKSWRGKLKAFVIKVIRKLIKPAVLPLIKQQNDINLRMAVIMNELADTIE